MDVVILVFRYDMSKDLKIQLQVNYQAIKFTFRTKNV